MLMDTARKTKKKALERLEEREERERERRKERKRSEGGDTPRDGSVGGRKEREGRREEKERSREREGKERSREREEKERSREREGKERSREREEKERSREREERRKERREREREERTDSPSTPRSPKTKTTAKEEEEEKSKMKPAVASLNRKAPAPRRLKDWASTKSRGVVFVDEDGRHSSHHFVLKLEDPSNVWITVQLWEGPSHELMDTDPKAPVDVVVYVMRRGDDDDNDDDDGTTTKLHQLVTFTEHRDATGKYHAKCDLDAGVYRLVPATSGCRLQARKAQPKADIKLTRQDRDGNVSLAKPFVDALDDIFHLSDLDGNGTLSRSEFSLFNVRTSGESITDAEWRVVEDNVHLDAAGEITRRGFAQLHRMEAEDAAAAAAEEEDGGDADDDLWVTLAAMGFNKALLLDEAVPFSLEVWTEDGSPSLRPCGPYPFSPLVDHAITAVFASRGFTTKSRIAKDVVIHTYNSDYKVMLAAENRGAKSRRRIRFDCGASRNAASQLRGRALTASVDLEPKTMALLFQLVPVDETKPWSVSWKEEEEEDEE